jgi:competence protein ComEC
MSLRWQLTTVVALTLFLGFGRAEEAPRGLDIYFVDTEGGAATLVVTPAGESVLIDCGFPGSRDAQRIRKAAQAAGLTQIDHLIISHWHSDHHGGVGRLAQLLPIKQCYDHGIPAELSKTPANFMDPLLIDEYRKVSRGKSKAVKPGDEIALQIREGTPAPRILFVCSNGEVLPDKPAAPENLLAKDNEPKAEDKTDNAKSVGCLLRYGDFRFLDLGDLTWNIEYKLVYPSDKLGRVDVYQGTHHGLESSNNPALVRTVQPRVVVISNGPRKGAVPVVLATLRRLPDVPAIYQLHRNTRVGPAENTDPEFIANNDAENCQGEFIKVAVAPDSKSYTVTVGGKNKPRKFETREAK